MTARIAKLAGLLILLAIAFSSGVAWRTWASAKKKDARKPLYYVDPMHPWYKSDRPGIAPDCGMKLEPVYEGAGKPKDERKPIYYRDPKQPEFRADAPGINPETGNDLEPVFEEIPGNVVTAAADKHELLGLTFGTVERVARNTSIRSTGRIAVDETRVERVHSKTEGWIEKTFVNYTGELVRKGQPLLTLYSPEMLASQRELLLALKARETMHHSTVDALRGGGEAPRADRRDRAHRAADQIDNGFLSSLRLRCGARRFPQPANQSGDETLHDCRPGSRLGDGGCLRIRRAGNPAGHARASRRPRNGQNAQCPRHLHSADG
jgi:hypothetical protein